MTSWARRTGLVVGEIGLGVLAVALAVSGFGAVLDTTEGRAIDPELDPVAPGYEAFVESTPTVAVLGRSAEGGLAWVSVLALAGPDAGGGAVLNVPVATLAPDFAVDLPTVGEIDLARGSDEAAASVGDIIGAAVDEVVDVDPARLAELVAPVAPLTLDNPDAAPGFPVGPTTLDPANAAGFLLATEPGESDLTRLVRHEAFWQAWLGAIAAAGRPDAVPGETASGIGRFLAGLAAGPVTVAVAPVRPEDAGDGTVEYRPDRDAAYDLTERLVPFPASPRPGHRRRVRVLDGVGADDLARRAARDAVAAGGQIVVVGNADRFDPDAVTRVVYFEPEVATAAEDVASAFGTVAEQLGGPNPDDGVDITVVAGADLLAAYGLGPRQTIGDDAG
jgi:hypothetical protein